MILFLSLVRRRHSILLALFLAVSGLLAPGAAQGGMPSHPLTLAVSGSYELFGSEANAAATRIRRAGFSTVMIDIAWSDTAPVEEPANWNPSDPTDPHYDWSSADAAIKPIVNAGFEPIVQIKDAPVWARLSPIFLVSPSDPVKYGEFLRAAAERYSGTNPGVPRVRIWSTWNEPNIGLFFWPQFDFNTHVFTSPDVYRAMVNAAAASIHAVHADNIVIAGNTAPFHDVTPGVLPLDNDWGPLKFMRRMLCIDDAGQPTCNDKAAFDVWATHPYASGGPLHHAQLPYDVSLGDLPKMRATLDAAVRAGHVLSASPVRFWVTEFSWDSNPPDRCAPPMALLKRWIPEAFYRMWADGIDLITWFKLVDDPMTSTFFQSGLFFQAPSFAAAKAKPIDEAFRLPFVALRRGGRVYVWAHTPFGKPGRVVVQQTVRGGWKPIATLSADQYGIVQAVLNVKPVGQFRAVLRSTGERSLPFSMLVPRDRWYNPFGTPALTPNAASCT